MSYIRIMKDLQIDIMCLQETHINTNSYEETYGYFFIFSTSVSDKERDERNKQAKEKASQRKGKGKGKGRESRKGQQLAIERAGVGFIIDENILATVQDIEQISGRNIKLTLNSYTNPIHIISTYAPQSSVGNNENDRDKIKDQYYDELNEIIDGIPEAEILKVMGDFNARLHYRDEDETDIMGPHIFGRGTKILTQSSRTGHGRQQI